MTHTESPPPTSSLETLDCFLYLLYNETFLLESIMVGLNHLFCPPSQDPNGQIHQVWYDDPQSICRKADYVKTARLRGIGMWNGNCLDYSDETVARQQTTMMWNALLGC